MQPWIEVTDERLVLAAQRNALDAETQGRLLHHIANCPKCQRQAKNSFYAKSTAGEYNA